jgi:hypothetical protein
VVCGGCDAARETPLRSSRASQRALGARRGSADDGYDGDARVLGARGLQRALELQPAPRHPHADFLHCSTPITLDGVVQRVQSLAAYPMDYQSFNGQQPSFGGFSSSAHSPQSALPPQAQFQQANQSFPYGSQFPSNAPAFPSSAGLVGHGPGGGSSSASGAPMNMMQQPMQPGAGGMQRGERVTCAHRSRPFVSCALARPRPLSMPSCADTGAPWSSRDAAVLDRALLSGPAVARPPAVCPEPPDRLALEHHPVRDPPHAAPAAPTAPATAPALAQRPAVQRPAAAPADAHEPEQARDPPGADVREGGPSLARVARRAGAQPGSRRDAARDQLAAHQGSLRAPGAG